MQYNQLDFITTPLSHILRESTVALYGIGNTMNTYPLNDYILQSIFLRMTGAQEQKFKSIIWELAADDYEYRHDTFWDSRRKGWSNLADKNSLYKDMVSQIKKFSPNLGKKIHCWKNILVDNAKKAMKESIEDSFLISANPRQYETFNEILFKISGKCLDLDKAFFSGNDTSVLNAIYNSLYDQRNTCAHNTRSQRQNIPSLSMISNPTYIYNNYFLYFFVLLLIDEIIIKLFAMYKEAITYNFNAD